MIGAPSDRRDRLEEAVALLSLATATMRAARAAQASEPEPPPGQPAPVGGVVPEPSIRDELSWFGGARCRLR